MGGEGVAVEVTLGGEEEVARGASLEGVAGEGELGDGREDGVAAPEVLEKLSSCLEVMRWV